MLRALLLSAVALAGALHLPGVLPLSYLRGQTLNIKVNSMTSLKTHIPFDHYHLHYCSNQGKSFPADYDNFGEILYGDVVKPSLYNLRILEDTNCEIVCAPHTLDAGNKERFNSFIKNRYRIHMLLDNLPVYVEGANPPGHHITTGFHVGLADKADKPVLYNHLAFTVRYHVPQLKPGQHHTFTERAEAFLEGGGDSGSDGNATVARIVGFTVVPHSVDHSPDECSSPSFDPLKHDAHLRLDPKNASQLVTWSYSVRFVEDSTLTWHTRWDVYVRAHEGHRKHWVAVLNGTVVLLILTGLVAVIVLRTLRMGFTSYNDPENPEESREEAGWKVVYGDVFREPVHSDLFAVYIGTGCQLIGMVVATLLLALAGMLVPSNRGALLTVVLLLFVFLGCLSGYVTARMAKMFRRQSWATILLCSVYFPGQCFVVFFVVNLLMWQAGAANAVPFVSLLSLMALWFLVSMPLVFIGGVFGYRKAPIEHPCDIGPVARWVPEQKFYMLPMVSIPLIGLLPFGAAFVEIYFMLTSIWLGAYYQLFGFLAMIFIIVGLTCAELSIALIYFMLVYENHRWWWRSFFCCASAGIHLFLYSLYYFLTHIQVTHLWSIVLYMGYMGLISYAFGIVCGTFGFLASFWFVRRIYSSIRV